MYYIEFHHGYFGWLTLPTPYPTHEAAVYAAKCGATGYPRWRVVRLEYPPEG